MWHNESASKDEEFMHSEYCENNIEVNELPQHQKSNFCGCLAVSLKLCVHFIVTCMNDQIQGLLSNWIY
jgi:hypothetical protein